MTELAAHQPVECSRCGRRGRVGFVLMDRYADGTDEWRCRSKEVCGDRLRRAAGRHDTGGRSLLRVSSAKSRRTDPPC
jgi:hypothetical protein